MKAKPYDGSRYYHRIPGLFLPRDASYERTHADINHFIDNVPELTGTLEEGSVLIEHRTHTFIEDMNAIMALLYTIRARSLVLQAGRILRCLEGTPDFSLVRKLLRSFLTDVLSMSIAAQKAQKQDAGLPISEIEIHADMERNVQTICHLFYDHEFERAAEVIAELAERDPGEDAYLRLLNLIAAQKYEEAMATLQALQKRQGETMKGLMGCDFSKTILVVDDMPEILSFVNSTLKGCYTVIAVPGSEAALAVIRARKVDLFILDIDMPGMDGYELAQIIRQDERHLKTPLVFLTGNSTRAHVTRAMAIGCDDFIVKPTSHERLLTVAGKFLGVGVAKGH